MGLITKNVKEEDFQAIIHTLTCEETGKKLCNIIIRKDNNELEEPVFVWVKALSPFAQHADSGFHRIGGLLAFGPISKEESPRFSTAINDIQYEIGQDGRELATIIVEQEK